MSSSSNAKRTFTEALQTICSDDAMRLKLLESVEDIIKEHEHKRQKTYTTGELPSAVEVSKDELRSVWQVTDSRDPHKTRRYFKGTKKHVSAVIKALYTNTDYVTVWDYTPVIHDAEKVLEDLRRENKQLIHTRPKVVFM